MAPSPRRRPARRWCRPRTTARSSDYRALQEQIRELHRLLGKKTLEAEILREALQHADPKKRLLLRGPLPPRDGSR
jgi:transposase